MPAPQIILAQFSDSGASITVLFDIATDFNGETSSSWPCGDLFNFTSNKQTISTNGYLCSWLNLTSVQITFTSVATTLPQINDTLIIVGPLKQDCATALNLCSSRLTSIGQTISLRGPINPPVPNVVISTSALVGLCSDVIIDASASYGSGLRNWYHVTWNVESSNDVTAILAALNQATNGIYYPITIARNLFNVGNYNFTLTLENFFLQSSSSSVLITVNGDPKTPLLSLLGQNLYTIKPSSSLFLQVQGQIPACSGVATPLTYSWKIYLNKLPVSLASHSNDPRTYSLPAYSLKSLNAYTIVSTVTSGISASASVNISVVVIKGAIVAVISGGTSRTVPVSFRLSLDASSSYDQDSLSSILSYRWSCSRSNLTVVRVPCLINSSSSGAIISISPFNLVSGYTYSFTVNVSALDGRFGIATTTVIPTGTASTQTFIIGADDYRINQQNSLSLSGRCIASLPCTSYWTVTGSGLNPSLANISSTPTQRSFTISQLKQNVSFPLGIKAGSLIAGNTYSFQISSYVTGNPITLSFAVITVVINGPPTSGRLISLPSNGTALSTTFFISSIGWTSPSGDYPLQYDFSYQTSEGSTALTLALKSAKTSVSSTLAAGIASNSYNVIITVGAYSSYGAKSIATAEVTVTPNYDLSIGSFVKNVTANTDSYLLSSDFDSTFSTINAASSYITSILCDSALNCSSLNRNDCGPGTLPQTCGDCIKGYIGVSGSSNMLCKPSNQTWSTSICIVNDDCLYNQCSTGICAVPVKTCPNNCSSHGSCLYFDTYGNSINTCYVNSTTCQARCICDPNYGGYSCSLDSADSLLIEDTISKICTTLSAVYDLQDYSSQLLNSLLASLYTAYNAYASSSTILNTCVPTFSNISLIANSGYVDSDTTINLLANLISHFAISLAFLQNSTSSNMTSRRLSSNSSTTIPLSEQLSTSLSSMYVGVIQYMTDGQTPINISTDAVKAVINRELLSELSSATLTPYDAVGTESPYIMLPSSGLSNCGGFVSGYAHYSVMQWAINPYSDSALLVSPLLRWMSSSTVTSFNNSTVSKNSNSSTYFLFIEYSNTLNLSITSSAFENRTIPACVNHDNFGYFSCPCEISTYTDTNVTFLCESLETTLCPPTSTRRRLTDSISIIGTTNIAEFGVITNSLAAEFLSVNASVVNFHAAKGVVAFISILLLIFALGTWYFRRWDNLDRKHILYVAKAKTKKSAKDASTQSLLKLRDRIDRAFLTDGLVLEDLDEDDTELDRRRRWWRRYFTFPEYLRNHKNLLAKGDFIVRFIHAILRFHPFLCFLVGRSLVRTRTLRFLLLFKSFMVSLFTSTLIFGNVTAILFDSINE